MTEPITEFDDAFFYFLEYATGNIYIRFRKGHSVETPMSQLEKMKLRYLKTIPIANEQEDLQATRDGTLC